MKGDEVDPVVPGSGSLHELGEPFAWGCGVIGDGRAGKLEPRGFQLGPQREGLGNGHVRLGAHVRFVEGQ